MSVLVKVPVLMEAREGQEGFRVLLCLLCLIL